MNDGTDEPRDGTVADGGTESFSIADGDVTIPREGSTETMTEAKREFLLEIVRRSSLLQVLRSGSAEPGDVLNSVDMSRSTVHRAFNSLEEYDIVEQSDGRYELTNTGKILAEETGGFCTRAGTAMSLSPFLNSINGSGDGIPVEHFVDAKITRRTSRQPHATIHRIIELIERSDSLRMFSTVISPVYVDVGYREMMDGMKIEAIFDREIIDIMLSKHPEKAHETIATGNFDVFAHDGLPFELFIFDAKIGMAAHNENGNAELLIECDAPSAIEWAEDLYSEQLSMAEPLTIPDF